MSSRSKALATVSVLVLLTAAIAGVVHSSFTAVAVNQGNSFETGSVSLTGSGSEQVLFDLKGLEPASAPAKRCVKVTYGSTGALRSTVRLFGTTTGALADHLKLKVHRGSFTGTPPAAGACDGFTKTATLFDGTLAAYPDAWSAGIVDPDSAWESGESAVYQLEVSLADTDAAQGKSATQSFAFEARTS